MEVAADRVFPLLMLLRAPPIAGEYPSYTLGIGLRRLEPEFADHCREARCTRWMPTDV